MNIILIVSDQHNPSFCGCYGGITRTPHIDSIARNGVRFNNAYSNCPLCVPSRASMITGRYSHEIAAWDNCFPYDGEKVKGWGHHFAENNVHFTAIGKLDFKPGVDHGIEEEIAVKNRESLDVVGLFRDQPILSRPEYHVNSNWNTALREQGTTIESEVTVVEEAIKWLEKDRPHEPWILNINFQKPHSPWHPLPDIYNYYYNKQGSLSPRYLQTADELHEVERIQSFHTCGYMFGNEKVRKAHAAYNAIVEEHDRNIGRILRKLEELKIKEEVLIIYTSDHGEMARAHGIWEKITLYEDSVKVPMVMSGPQLPKGKETDYPVSLLDVYQTINDALGIAAFNGARGNSMLRMVEDKKRLYKDRPIFMESHANGRIAASFAVRKNNWKLIEYIGYDPLFFNLANDPNEMENLASLAQKDNEILNKMRELKDIIHTVCSPEEVDHKARKDQKNLREELRLTGKLDDELLKRGYRTDGQKLYHAKSI